MTNDITTSTAQAHVKGFVTSYAKCWEHYQGYMQDPSKTIEGFRQECQEEADEQGVDIKLPAIRTFENRTAKLKQAGVIPARLKSDTRDAVRMRNKRENEQSPKSGKCSPTDESQSSTTHLSPGKSDESPFIECNSYSPSTQSVVDEPSLQQGSRGVSFSEEVRSTQPEMDTDCPQSSDELVSMGTEASRIADADYEELKRLVRCIEAIHSRNLTTDGSGIRQDQWRDLSQQYKSIKYCADLRWQRLRAEMDREHEAFIEQLDNGLRAIGSKGAS